jgi:hypothetical protein
VIVPLRRLSDDGRDALRETLIDLCVSTHVLPLRVTVGRAAIFISLSPKDRGKFVGALAKRRRGLGFVYDAEAGDVYVFPCQDEEYQTT